jgi:two-component system response regulator DesR
MPNLKSRRHPPFQRVVFPGDVVGTNNPRTTSVRVVADEEHRLVLDALVETLNRIPEFDVVGIACDPPALPAKIGRGGPAVTVLNMHMAGNDGLELVQSLTDAVPSCGIVLLAIQPTQAFVDRALAAGALSVVPTNANLPNLVDAIRGVASGCVTLDPRLLCRGNSADELLSQRERQILRMTAAAAPVKDIARELYLSPGTVRNVSSSLIRRFKARNRFDAARIALERGLL